MLWSRARRESAVSQRAGFPDDSDVVFGQSGLDLAAARLFAAVVPAGVRFAGMGPGDHALADRGLGTGVLAMLIGTPAAFLLVRGQLMR